MMPNTPQTQPGMPADLPAVPVQSHFGQPGAGGMPGGTPGDQPGVGAAFGGQPAMVSMPASGPGMMPAAPAFAPASAGAAVPMAAGMPAALQVRQLVAQYGSDPFRLGQEFSRLKASHLARQYNILPNNPNS